VLARIKQQRTQAAVAELFYQDEVGLTALAVAAIREAPVEVLESMILLGKLDAKKRNILDIADIALALPMHYVAQHHPDPAAIKLLVLHHHSALLAKTNANRIPLDYAIKSNKSPAVVALLRKLATSYKHGHFSGLIRLCGTSRSLEALALRSTDDVPLLVLCECDSWEVASKRIETIPTQAVIEEMHQQELEGRTPFACAIVADGPVELLTRMVKLGKQDTKERNIVTVCDREGFPALGLAAVRRTDAATSKLLAREDPASLYSSFKCALEYNKKSTAVVSLQRECLAAWEHGNISVLVDICGESDVLLRQKGYVEKHPVHHVVLRTTDLAIIKSEIASTPPICSSRTRTATLSWTAPSATPTPTSSPS